MTTTEVNFHPSHEGFQVLVVKWRENANLEKMMEFFYIDYEYCTYRYENYYLRVHYLSYIWERRAGHTSDSQINSLSEPAI